MASNNNTIKKPLCFRSLDSMIVQKLQHETFISVCEWNGRNVEAKALAQERLWQLDKEINRRIERIPVPDLIKALNGEIVLIIR